MFLLLDFFAPSIFPQENQDSLAIQVETSRQIFNLQEKLDEIDFYFELNSWINEITFIEDPESIWLWTNIAMKKTQQSGTGTSLPSFISLPLYRQYMEDSKFNPVRMVLGMAQAGAVGYLAYKSIKKYGLSP